MKKNYFKIIAGTVFLSGFLLSGEISLAQTGQKEDMRTKHAGTLLGAILNLFHREPQPEEQHERLITGRIEREGFSDLPYVRTEHSEDVSFANADGDFIITVPLNETILLIGAPGLQEQILQLDEQESHYHIRLRVEDNNPFGKSGIHGLGIDDSRFNGVQTTLTAQDIRARSSATLDEVLVGPVPGLTASGIWNGVATNFFFTVRGRGALVSATAPLVVLDGAPYAGALNTINPNDVQYLTVLRDATGMAIYGNRGANGIILITTKSGRDNYME